MNYGISVALLPREELLSQRINMRFFDTVYYVHWGSAPRFQKGGELSPVGCAKQETKNWF